VRQRTERAATTDDNPVSVEEPPGRVTGRDWSGEMSITKSTVTRRSVCAGTALDPPPS
jgi:hypothetical protein